MIKKSKENLLPREKIIFKSKIITQKTSKLQRLDLNVKEVNNSFYKRLSELEAKLTYFESSATIPEDLISPVKHRCS